MIGKVVSNKMANTVVVAVESLKPHYLYHKRIKQTKKLKAHVDQELAIGKLVRIEGTKPFSKTTFYKVVEVLADKKGKK